MSTKETSTIGNAHDIDPFHDCLTETMNRQGFEQLVSSDRYRTGRIGLAMVEIDNFESIADNFGTAIASRVLIAVNEQLSSVFSSPDVVSRIDIDLFAVLLENKTSFFWQEICRRISAVHASLAKYFAEDLGVGVTLSVGLCISEKGFDARMHTLALDALAVTRKRGKAGCTQIGRNHHVLQYWHDDTLSLLAKNVLEYNNTGVCRIEMPDDRTQPCRLYCGDTVRLMLAIPPSAGPEETYRIWRDGIDPRYDDVIFRTMYSMAQGVQSECSILWKHPLEGMIHLRCGGYGVKRNGMTVFNGYCHTLKDTAIIERQSDISLILKALSDTYVATFYLDIENSVSYAVKIATSDRYEFQDSEPLEDVIHEFQDKIVDSRDREIIAEFLDVSTLQQRLGDEKFLDAEYRSLLLKCWCRVRFIPVRYDGDGTLTHTLVTITALDSAMQNKGYTLDYNRRNLAFLFDNVPCGIVMYEWDGESLNVLRISRYYKERFGHHFVKKGENKLLVPDFSCIHPEDYSAYRRAIHEAMNGRDEFHYEYRAWNNAKNDYIWERADAVISTQPNGSKYIYAIYTDITEQKEQGLRLEKSHASLLAALDASNQLCYEYDPVLHLGICLTDENFFNLPKCIENYPDSLSEIDLFHPEDAALFIQTAHEMDDGKNKAQCDVRIKKNGAYCWYSCIFNSYYDSEKERNVSILTVVDISLRMATLKTYEERLHSLASITENTLYMTNINLSDRSYEVIECKPEIKRYLDTTLPLDEFLSNAASCVVGEESRKQYLKKFNVKYLLEEAAKGNLHTQQDHLMKTDESHYEWVSSEVNLIVNPINGSVSGVGYARSRQVERMSAALLEKTLEQDYLFAAAIFVDTDDFYLYNSRRSKFTPVMTNYWDAALNNVTTHCSEETLLKLREMFVKQTVLEHLEHNSEYTFAFDSFMNDDKYRLEVRFCYLDKEHTMLLASMRNITDVSLFEQYRHDSEHDSLTDLYNRKKFFARSRELLDAHPRVRFAMVHVDIKHFRLYNTFFGEAAGDQLLCALADQFRWMDKDYEYWAYGRIAADVFAAFLPYNEERFHSHVEKVLKNVRAFRSDFLIEPELGLYLVEDSSMSMEAMFARATMAAKMVQPDTPFATVFFNSAMEKTLVEDQQILNDMQTAIEEEQFVVYLQPKYSLRTEKPVGAEALVRWNHPVRGLITPGRFIPLFESNGFISTLDRYMWEHTCRILSRWKREGRKLMPVSVNCSRISIYSPDTVGFLKSLVEKYDIEPKYLELELTESAYVDSPEDIKPRLAELQSYGFKLLMDDFGSGYSSLNTLKDLPFDVLKLDMNFISVSNTSRGSKIISSVVRMCKLLGLAIIAEGVETEVQANYLRSIGCEYVQGFLLARPMPVEQFEEHIGSLLCFSDSVGFTTTQPEPVVEALLDPSDTAEMIDANVPNPVSVLGYQNGEFCFLRTNQVFLEVFDLKEDLCPVSRVFKEKLSPVELARMMRALDKCAATHQSVSFKIHWPCKEGGVHPYLVNLVYEGAIGVENVMVMAFIDIEPADFIE